MRVAIGFAATLLLSLGASAAPPDVTIPKDVHLPELKPLIAPCADVAADRFVEVDISQRAPADATKVQKVSGWVTADGVFHWPFVMRARNIGDKPFVGKPGKQRVIVTETDTLAGNKSRVVATAPFDRVDPRSGIAARFLFEAPAADVNKLRFHKVYTLSIKYDVQDEQLINGQYGDCDLRNNEYAIEVNGGRKGWVHGK